MIVLSNSKPKGIIWISSYPRSGNTWTRAFISSLLSVINDASTAHLDINQIDIGSAVENAATLYPRFLGKPVALAKPAEIAAARPWVQAALVESAGRPIYLKTHLANGIDHGVPLINMGVSLGAIYLVRNPLDVAVSYAHFTNSSIDITIKSMATSGFGIGKSRVNGHDRVRVIMGSWSENVSSWIGTPHPAVLAVRYEDMVDSPVKTFGRVARHLKLNPSKRELQRAIEMSSFERLRGQEALSGFGENPENAGDRFFREGRAGQWRERLSDEQVAKIIADHRPLMKRFGYLPQNR